jgi:transcriptional regulator with PAS, ATPase and Fis domain
MTCRHVEPHPQRVGKNSRENDPVKEAEAAQKRRSCPAAPSAFHFNEICGQNNRLSVRCIISILALKAIPCYSSGRTGPCKDVFAPGHPQRIDTEERPYNRNQLPSIPRRPHANELFGHSEGAFTGSRRGGNTGKFEAADGGTLFLDEIAETSLEFQAALLRVVEEKAIVRVGGTSVRPVDVRIIAATNKNILEEIRKGNFRSDLYYRLNVFTIEMTPLRERKDDIPLLVDNFIKKYCDTTGRNVGRISESVLRILANYPWPGNIRELQNVIERMMNVAQGNELTADLVPDEILHWQYQDTENHLTAQAREKEAIIQMMGIGIPRNKIAQKMNMARSTFYRKLKGYGLN